MDETQLRAQYLAGAAIVDPGVWQIVDVTGGDRLSFLHRLLTARIEDLQPGQGRRALLLTVKAQIVTELRVCVETDRVRLLVPPGQGETAHAALSRYAIMDDVALALAPALPLLAVYGPESVARLRAAGVGVPAQAEGGALSHGVTADGSWVVAMPGLGVAGLWVFAADDVLTRARAALATAGVATLSAEIADGLRVLAGEPKTGHEITGDVFPMEVGLDPMIDYGKGCYLGQEPIVRVRDRGHVNWRLVGLRLREEGVIAAGDRIETAERPKAGRLTSVARLPGAPPLALALLHVSVPAGTVVKVRARPAGDPENEGQLLAADVIPVAGA